MRRRRPDRYRPGLESRGGGLAPSTRVIYLDYNATAPVEPAVAEAMLPYLGGDYGNPSSAHRLGSRARCAVEDARERVAALIGAAPAEIVFTSGGTESNNLAVFGLASAMERPAHAVTLVIEHASVLAPMEVLERRGWRVTRLRVDGRGRIDPGDLAAALRQDTVMVSIGWANNEIGAVQAIEQVGSLCRARGVRLHVDAVQAAGRIPIGCAAVDAMSLSAHKIGGPKGAGALYVRRGLALAPLVYGGPQERKRRAGTENVAGAVGFAVACEIAARNLARMGGVEALRERLWLAVRDLPGVRRHSPSEDCLPNTLNIGCAGRHGDAIVAAMDMRGIAVSSGSACAAGASEPSHVLAALGLDEEAARCAVRFSLGAATTAEDVDRAAAALREILGATGSGSRREAAHG